MHFPTIIIGAGQAGLSAGYFLKKRGLDFIILEKEREIGWQWKSRYDSLVLFTPSQYSGLPGLNNPIPKGQTPNKNEVASYLKQYCSRFDLPVKHNCKVLALKKEQSVFIVETSEGNYSCENIIIATGPFQVPYVPQFGTLVTSSIFQLHSSEYKNPEQIPKGNVVVVGGGNSGAQIAAELYKTRHTAISVRKKIKFGSLKLFGKSIFWWGKITGAFTSSKDSFIGKRLMKKGDVVYYSELKELIKKKVVKVYPEIKTIKKDVVSFSNGEQYKVKTIIWATGFKEDFSWIEMPKLFNKNGILIHKEGITAIKGLFFIGLSWQRSRSSALIMGAGRDAEFITRQIN